MVRQGDLGLFARLLVVSPGGLAIALLLSHSLVLLLHLLGIGSFSSSVFVFEHASHAKNGFFLRGPVGFLLAIRLSGSHVLTMLLVSPIALVLRIQPHSIEVHCTSKNSKLDTIRYSFADSNFFSLNLKIARALTILPSNPQDRPRHGWFEIHLSATCHSDPRLRRRNSEC